MYKRRLDRLWSSDHKRPHVNMWESPSKFPQQLRKVVHRKNSHDSFKIGTHHCYILSAVCFAYKIPETSDVSVVPVLSELST